MEKAELRNPYAIKAGRMITIYDLSESERGLACSCKCPLCDAPFVARMGEKRQAHFAHSGEACPATKAYVVSTYKIVEQILLDRRYIVYPADFLRGKQLFESGLCRVETVNIQYDNNGMAKALTVNGDQMAIRLELNMEYCVEGIHSAYEEISTLLIDMTSVSELDYEILSKRICDSLDGKTWIFNKISQREEEKYQKEQEERMRQRAIEQEERERKEREAAELRRKQIEEENQRRIERQKASAEEDLILLKQKKMLAAHKQKYIDCSICGKQVYKDDVRYGLNTRRYYCYKCIEERELDWRKL